MKDYVNYIGAFDLMNYADVAQALIQTLGLSEDEIHERLFKEALNPGWNVSSAAAAFGVTPHVYDERMEAFYKNTDAFVFETLVSHLGPACQEIDRRVVEAAQTLFAAKENVKALALADGIGSDSLRFAAMGYEVTYFDFEAISSAFARYRFQRQRLDHKITMLHRLDDIPDGGFDLVVCREALEHVVDPPAVIENIWRYLNDAGIAIITESFGRVEAAFPTHLAANRKYDGKTELLFVEAGFRLLASFPDKRPMIFRKTAKEDGSRFASLEAGRENRSGAYVIQNKLRRIGGRALRLVRF